MNALDAAPEFSILTYNFIDAVDGFETHSTDNWLDGADGHY